MTATTTRRTEDAMATNHNTTPQPTVEGWRTTIDGWVRDPAIRNFGLTTLVVLLIGAALIVGLASGAFAAAVNTLLPNLFAQAIAGSAISTAGGTLWYLKGRASRRTRTATAAQPLIASPKDDPAPMP
jgi:hypothetical protein